MKVKYISDDFYTFDTEQECRNHEKNVLDKKYEELQKCKVGTQLPPEMLAIYFDELPQFAKEAKVSWYFLKTVEDYILINEVSNERIYDNTFKSEVRKNHTNWQPQLYALVEYNEIKHLIDFGSYILNPYNKFLHSLGYKVIKEGEKTK